MIPAADHRFRMERMLYAERVTSAQRVAALAGAKALAEAWAAVIRGERSRRQAAQGGAGRAALGRLSVRRGQDICASRRSSPKRRRSCSRRRAIAPALVDPDAWWVERRVLSRELVDHGDMKTAYRIAAAHAAESPANAADAEFHAGWYALRGLDDAKTAARHFARIAEIADGPISLSRAYYWLGRAAEAGGPGDAKAYYRRPRPTAPPSTASSPQSASAARR